MSATRPDVTAGPISRSLIPENVSDEKGVFGFSGS